MTTHFYTVRPDYLKIAIVYLRETLTVREPKQRNADRQGCRNLAPLVF